jgi:hypothetical protein
MRILFKDVAFSCQLDISALNDTAASPLQKEHLRFDIFDSVLDTRARIVDRSGTLFNCPFFGSDLFRHLVSFLGGVLS